MRYRVKDYTVQPIAGGVWLYFTAPQGVELSSDPDNEIEPFIQEAIRLVIDESEGIVLCSSMQKRVYLERAKCTPATREIRLQFAIPEGKTVSSVSVFTIEMDWGESPEDMKIAIPTDYAKEEQATSNKNEVKQEIRNVAGSCIIPDYELPCLPFEKYGFSGLENDGEFYFGDFAPQAGDLAYQLFVGAIIKVTGDNATEDEFAGFPAGSGMSVAHTVSEEEAGYEQGLYGSLQDGDPVYGVISVITWQKDHYYRVTGFHDIYDMTNHEVVEGYVITYEEVDPATITYMGKKIVEKLDEVKEETAKETTAQEIKQLIINEGIERANEYAAEIREIIGDWSNE